MGTVVIGIGNPDRGDDAIGRVVAARLRGRVPASVAVMETDGEATGLMARFGTAANAILVDASLSGAPPGTIRRFDAVRQTLPSGKLGLSTHGFGLAEAIELARALGCLPKTCVVYAVEGDSFEPGEPLSPEVEAAADDVVERVLAETRKAS
jgi:hydrogenase maturation protease